jgi:hypothetical protein
MKKLNVLLFLSVAFFASEAKATTYYFLDDMTSKFLFTTGAAPNTTLTFTMTQSNAGIIAFSDSSSGPWTATLQVVINTDANGNGNSATFWMKGVGLGETNMQGCAPGEGCIPELPIGIAGVSTLELISINSTIDDNPNSGGGKRYYPDKQTPTDNTVRKKVRVRATLTLPAPNFGVLFQSYDMDDPTFDASPVDSNDTGGVKTGGDNRAATNKEGIMSLVNQTGTTNKVTAVSNGSGVAEADLWTTMNPGDNFMVASAAFQSILDGLTVNTGNGTTLKDAEDNPLPLSTAKASPMLTVWRKLHLEYDSMASVGTLNNVTGTVTEILQATTSCAPPAPNPCFPTATVYKVSPALAEPRRFDNGRIKIGNKSFDVWFNDTGYVYLKGQPSGSTNGILGKGFVLFDDDDYNADDPQKNGDDGDAIVAFTDSFRHLQSEDGNYSDGTPKNLYAQAYITPDRAWTAAMAYNQSNVTFNLNLEYSTANTTILSGVINQRRNSSLDERDDFWVAYLVFGYQGPLLRDFDGVVVQAPNTFNEPSDEGVALQNGPPCDCLNSSVCPVVLPAAKTCTVVPLGADGAVVFQEVIRDAVNYFLNPPPPLFARAVTDMAAVTAHELTHQFGVLGDEKRPTFMIMDYPDYTVGTTTGPSISISPEHINIIRSRIKSPGN